MSMHGIQAVHGAAHPTASLYAWLYKAIGHFMYFTWEHGSTSMYNAAQHSMLAFFGDRETQSDLCYTVYSGTW